MPISKKNKNGKVLIGLSSSNSTYTIGRVKYIIKSKFKRIDDKHTLSNQMKKYITSDFANLQVRAVKDKIDTSCVYSTAGKEDANAVEKEK